MSEITVAQSHSAARTDLMMWTEVGFKFSRGVFKNVPITAAHSEICGLSTPAGTVFLGRKLFFPQKRFQWKKKRIYFPQQSCSNRQKYIYKNLWLKPVCAYRFFFFMFYRLWIFKKRRNSYWLCWRKLKGQTRLALVFSLCAKKEEEPFD